MDIEGFRNRLNQYKKAREENPGLKYWEWKAIPKYDEGGEVLEQYYAPKTVEGIITKTAIQLADPTGVSSYPDVWYSGKKFLNSPSWSNLKDVGINTLSALPLIGKVTAPFKAAKMAKLLARIEDANALVKGVEHANRLNKVIDTVPELLPVVRRGAEKVQDVTSALMTNPIFNYISNQNKFDLVRNYRNMNAAVDAVNISNNTVDVTQGIESLMGYSEGGQVEPDPLEVLERSKPKFHGIPLAKGNIDGVFSPIDVPLATLPKVWSAVNKWLPNYGPTLGALIVGDNGQPVNKSAKPIATKRIEPDVEEFYRDIVIPLRPQEDYVKNIYLNRPGTFKYNVYPDDAIPSNRVAEYNPITGEIRVKESMLNSPQLDQTLAHDGSHDLEKLQRTKEAQDIIDEALVAQKNPISKESNLIQEKGAEVTRMGYNAFKYMKDNGLMQVKNPLAKTKAYQDYVLNATQEQLAEMMGDFTAYSRDYKAGKIDYDKIRWALAYAPEIAVGLIVPQHLLNGNKEEKQWT